MLKQTAQRLTGGNWMAVFEMLDRDGSGAIDCDELRLGVRHTLKVAGAHITLHYST